MERRGVEEMNIRKKEMWRGEKGRQNKKGDE